MPLITTGKTVLYKPSIDVLAVAPPGGTAGQVLAKIDGDDYNNEWVDLPEEPKVYVALLTQVNDPEAPSAVILKNTLIGTPTFEYVSEGRININLIDGFTNFNEGRVKFIPIAMDLNMSVPNCGYLISKISNDTLQIRTFVENAPSDGLFQSTKIKIEVYP